MKIILHTNQNYVFRLDKGEEIVAGIAGFMQGESIEACSFTGVGSCSNLELGFFNEHLKDYRKKTFIDNMEIISLTGNGAVSGGKPLVHCHGMFGHNDFTTVGGHVFTCVTLATCEISLTKLEGKMERKNNPDFNLNLLT